MEFAEWSGYTCWAHACNKPDDNILGKRTARRLYISLMKGFSWSKLPLGSIFSHFLMQSIFTAVLENSTHH